MPLAKKPADVFLGRITLVVRNYSDYHRHELCYCSVLTVLNLTGDPGDATKDSKSEYSVWLPVVSAYCILLKLRCECMRHQDCQPSGKKEKSAFTDSLLWSSVIYLFLSSLQKGCVQKESTGVTIVLVLVACFWPGFPFLIHISKIVTRGRDGPPQKKGGELYFKEKKMCRYIAALQDVWICQHYLWQTAVFGCLTVWWRETTEKLEPLAYTYNILYTYREIDKSLRRMVPMGSFRFSEQTEFLMI